MHWFFAAAVSNAFCVVPLALAVTVITRLSRRPVLTHTLWVLVLLKFLTPAIWEVAVVVPLGAESAGLVSAVFPELVIQSDDAPTIPAISHAFAQMDLDFWSGQIPSFGRNLPVSQPDQYWRWMVLTGMATVWVMGVAAALRNHWRSNLRFGLCLSGSLDGSGSAEVQQRTRGLAERIGLKRVPRAVLMSGAATPMLWGLGPWVRIVFPRELWESLPAERRDSLLVHEIGHFQRGDHWVRLIELLATSIFWWHPVVWWARREISIAEEECCDAWVVRVAKCAPKTYAAAIIDALDHVAESCAVRPSLAIGVTETGQIEMRITQIMQQSVESVLNWSGWALLAVTAAASIPWKPTPKFVAPPVELAPPVDVEEVSPAMLDMQTIATRKSFRNRQFQQLPRA